MSGDSMRPESLKRRLRWRQCWYAMGTLMRLGRAGRAGALRYEPGVGKGGGE